MVKSNDVCLSFFFFIRYNARRRQRRRQGRRRRHRQRHTFGQIISSTPTSPTATIATRTIPTARATTTATAARGECSVALVEGRRVAHEELHERLLELLVAEAVDEKVARAVDVDEDDGEARADQLDLEGAQRVGASGQVVRAEDRLGQRLLEQEARQVAHEQQAQDDDERDGELLLILGLASTVRAMKHELLATATATAIGVSRIATATATALLTGRVALVARAATPIASPLRQRRAMRRADLQSAVLLLLLLLLFAASFLCCSRSSGPGAQQATTTARTAAAASATGVLAPLVLDHQTHMVVVVGGVDLLLMWTLKSRMQVQLQRCGRRRRLSGEVGLVAACRVGLLGVDVTGARGRLSQRQAERGETPSAGRSRRRSDKCRRHARQTVWRARGVC